MMKLEKTFVERILSDIFRGKFIPLKKTIVDVTYRIDAYSVKYVIYKIALCDKYKEETGEFVEINIYYDENGVVNMIEMFNPNGGWDMDNNSIFDERLIENIEHALNLEVFEETDNIELQKLYGELDKLFINQEETTLNDIQDEYLKGIALDANLSDGFYCHDLAEWVL